MAHVVEVANADITLRVEVTGDGPVILCVHGWPECALSWRHQVAHLSERGYTAAAMDVRGYGGSTAPEEIERYSLRELASDVAAVAGALSDEPVVLIGHDWGAPICYDTAVRHPDRVRAVAGLSAPHLPPGDAAAIDLFDMVYAEQFFYFCYFQEPGIAEAEFADDLRLALKTIYHAVSGDGDPHSLAPDAPRDAAPMLPLLPTPPTGPLPFLTDDELDAYVRSFERSGLHGAFNRYRATRIDHADVTSDHRTPLAQPCAFIAGSRDNVRYMFPGADLFDDPAVHCADLRLATIVEGAGHWVQQEAPAEVNQALEQFLSTL